MAVVSKDPRTSNESIPDEAELLDRARKLVPVLRERIPKTEALKMIPPETIEDLKKLGLLKLGTPKKYGGYALRYQALGEIITEVAKGCPSTAWVLALMNGSSWTLAQFPEQAQDEFFLSSSDPTVCGSLAPTGSVTEVEGGYELSGRWPFTSGIDHASWNTFSGLLFEEVTGRMDMRFFMVPKKDFRIIDDWETVGMRGTGSKTVTMDKVFVPRHRSLAFEYIREGSSPHASLHDDIELKVPYYAFTPIAYPVVGMARAALEYWQQWNRDRFGIDGLRVADKPFTQLRLAECGAEIDAAESIMRRGVDLVVSEVTAGRKFTPEQRAKNGRDTAFAVQLCLRAVDRLIDAAGAHGLSEKSPLQRAWRDIHSAASHIAMRWEVQGQAWGRLAFGLPLESPLFY